MNSRIALLLTVLIILALLPWVIASCADEPLLPSELELEPLYYQQTVDASQQQTRQAPAETAPPPKVVTLGTTTPPAESFALTSTAAATVTAPISATSDLTQSVAVANQEAITPTNTINTPLPTPTVTLNPASSVRIISTVVATQTLTPSARIIVVQSTLTPDAAPHEVTGSEVVTQTGAVTTSTAAVTATSSVTTSTTITNTTATLAPYRPAGMVEVTDILTERMLVEQANRDLEDGTLSNLAIELTSDGFRATATTQVIGTVAGDVVATGTFAVENESLVVNIARISVNGIDVTARHRATVEDSITSSLYRLLPRRFVQSYAIQGDEIVVQSLMRP